MGEFMEARLLAPSTFSCALMPFVKNRPIGKQAPNGTILVSGIGEIGALRVFEAMCHSDSLMRPRRLEMLRRDCWQFSSPVQNPRPALRFRLGKRDDACRPKA